MAELYGELARWITANGGSTGPLQVGEAEDGERGIFAAEAVPPGTLLAEIPPQCTVTLESAVRYPCVGRVAAGWPNDNWGQTGLAVFLLEQRRVPDRWWAAFLESLPQRWDHVPIFFGEEELRLLAGSSIPIDSARRKLRCREELARIVWLAPDLAGISPEDYVRARVTVATRVFSTRREGGVNAAMTPMADMLNHAARCDTVWEFDQCGRFLLRSARPIEKGAEVYCTYGRKSNTHLLMNYGFTLADNPDDEATIRIAAPNWGVEFDRRSRGFGVLDDGRRRFRLSRRGPEGADVISFLRLAFAQGMEQHRAMAPGPEEIPMLSERNEGAAREALAHACRNALRRYPSTIEEDDALLGAAAAGNARNCIVARRGEKAVLRAWAEWAERGPLAKFGD
ncbi:MAG TPA: SET domain-containing histone-lysine N-methyltransferase [Bryobacteraceae bacterium]|jgi:hypothetical protein|nr:SET domain-containing histone-lysine N-methyltransferase [Bryobacteraceae bacterium]